MTDGTVGDLPGESDSATVSSADLSAITNEGHSYIQTPNATRVIESLKRKPEVVGDIDLDDKSNLKKKVKVGYKGKLIIPQVKTRKLKKKEQYKMELIMRGFGGDKQLYENFMAEFTLKNKSDRDFASGMLAEVIRRGQLGWRLLSAVLKIGYGRYKRITSKEYTNDSEPLPGKAKPGPNKNKVSDEQIAILELCRNSIPIDDIGYACNHRRQISYIGDSDITSIEKLYVKYYLNNKNFSGKVMALPTFRKYWDAYHSDLRFRTLKEDECDTCLELKTGNLIILIHFFVTTLTMVFILINSSEGC